MFEKYPEKNKKRRFFKHFSNEKERHLSGLLDQDELEIAYSDADDITDLFYPNGYDDFLKWQNGWNDEWDENDI